MIVERMPDRKRLWPEDRSVVWRGILRCCGFAFASLLPDPVCERADDVLDPVDARLLAHEGVDLMASSRYFRTNASLNRFDSNPAPISPRRERSFLSFHPRLARRSGPFWSPRGEYRGAERPPESAGTGGRESLPRHNNLEP